MTENSFSHAKESVKDKKKKIIFVSNSNYDEGIIGLISSKLSEEFYKPSIVISLMEDISKGSARSIKGFNIIQNILKCKELLVDVGGHPMAAGFTIETKNIESFKKKIYDIADKKISSEELIRLALREM